MWQAETLLNATYFVYGDCFHNFTRCEQYNVPAHISTHLDFITPTTQFPITGPRRRLSLDVENPSRLAKRQQANDDPCEGSVYITPACITKTYNVNYTASPNRTSFAIFGTEAASYSASNTQDYLQQFNPAAAAAKPQFQVIGSGDPDDGTPGIGSTFEVALDTQTSLGLAWPASAVFYNTGGVFGPSSSSGKTYDRFVQFLQDLINNQTVPSVVSFSESIPEDMMDPAYAQRLCTMMAQVGMRGISLLFSSGNNGPNGDVPTGTHKMIFEPEFPASCPWVTSVGGTTNPSNETAVTKQTTSDALEQYIASGGGFSNIFARPAYQDDVVSAYIDQHVPSTYHSVSGFNASGRGIPDVSALSTSFPVVVSGLTVPVGGTSAATPVWAALITLLNDYEASQGRPSLGFLNPWLYSIAKNTSGIHDIVTGGNSAGSCSPIAGCTLNETLGYDVAIGWDPVTGLGSPNFAALQRSLCSQQCTQATGAASSQPSPSSVASGTRLAGGIVGLKLAWCVLGLSISSYFIAT